MYITKYWGSYIGDTDDSLTLVEYLAEKQKEEIPLGEIFCDFGLDKLHGDFRNPDFPLVFELFEEGEIEVHYAIDLITDLAGILLECKVNGSVDLYELADFLPNSRVRITAAPEEHELMNKALMDFTATPLSYDLCEMVPEEEMLEVAAACEELRKELYG